jgi:hypothetical protein
MAWAQMIGAGLQVGAAGASYIRGANRSTLRGLEEAREAARNTEVPDEALLRYNLEMLKSMGQLTPEMEQEIMQESSGMNHISTDPVLRQAQMSALTNMERRGREGLTLEDRAAQEDINRGIQTEQRAGQEAVLQNMQARGQLGSGGELAAQLAASQAGADQARQQGSDLARQVAASRLQAQMNAGQMGGDIRQQEFGEQSAKATAQDLINKFNTASRQNVQTANVGARNIAQEKNLLDKRALEQNRVDTTNNQKIINRNAYMDAMEARNQKRSDIAGMGLKIGMTKDDQFKKRMEGVSEAGKGASSMGGMTGGGVGKAGGGKA